MSEHDNDTPVLIRLREQVARGDSVFGPEGSYHQIEKLKELDAKIELGRQLGELPAAVPIEARVRMERLAQEFPGGDPGEKPFQQDVIAFRLDPLAALPERIFDQRVAEVTADLKNRTTEVTFPHSHYRAPTAKLGDYASGREISDALIAEAEPAIRQYAQTSEAQTKLRKLLRADRGILETFALRGRQMTAYAERKKAIGV